MPANKQANADTKDIKFLVVPAHLKKLAIYNVESKQQERR